MNSNYVRVACNDLGLVSRSPIKKTFKHRLAEWLVKGDIQEASDFSEPREVMSDERLNVDPIRLNIYRASGGYIVETRMRDTTHIHRDHDYRLHIVSDRDGKDLGEALSEILTMETLRA